jgi:hypothetical protein
VDIPTTALQSGWPPPEHGAPNHPDQVEAFREYDAFFHLSRRRYIPPNFAELRHILNIAQVWGGEEGR